LKLPGQIIVPAEHWFGRALHSHRRGRTSLHDQRSTETGDGLYPDVLDTRRCMRPTFHGRRKTSRPSRSFSCTRHLRASPWPRLNETHFVIDMHTMAPVFGMLKEHVAPNRSL
jgi:hypothetical protein